MRDRGSGTGRRTVRLAVGAFLVMPAALFGQDSGEYRHAEVAGWEIEQPELAADPEPYEVVRGASMRRRSEAYFLEYEVNGGLRRTVGVQRLSCGEATDANGGAMYSAPIYMTGSIEQAAGAVRAAVREVDPAFDDSCPARPAQLEAALAGLETALVIVEQWARERPLPDREAWERGSWSMERSEPPVTIRFSRPPGGEEERHLAVEVAGCGEPYSFSEEATVPVPSDAAGRARARSALADLLRQAQARCALPADQVARLLAGFEEAVAASESEY